MKPKFVYDSEEVGNYVSLEYVTKVVTSIMERYPEATYVQLVAGGDGYDGHALSIHFSRHETEEERRKEELRTKQAEEYERKQYEKLRKKFGDK